MAANPRAAAVAALVRQEQDGFSNLILDAELRRRELDGRDKAFASAIFYTVLEPVSYTHLESAPRYSAHEVARQRAAENGALLLLASATPSTESYFAAQKGRTQLVRLRCV